MATYAFTVQIYCDFAGYSAIAIGSALLLGVRLPDNFRRPYLSLSISEFWRRWHISLSSWLRDYLYIPLGGNRGGTLRTYRNLLVTMLLGGIWHGAGWHWLIWGGIQGGVMIVERLVGIREEYPASLAMRLVRWIVTLHIVCLSWIFFRAHDVRHACVIITRIATCARGEFYAGYVPLVVMLVIIVLDLFHVERRWVEYASQSPRLLKWVTYGSVLALALTFLGASNPEFLYFQF